MSVFILVALAEAYRAIQALKPSKEDYNTFSRFYFALQNGETISAALQKAKEEPGNWKRIQRMIEVYFRFKDLKNPLLAGYGDVLDLGGLMVYTVEVTPTGFKCGDDIYVTNAYLAPNADPNGYIQEALTIMTYAPTFQRLAEDFPNKYPDLPYKYAFADRFNAPPLDPSNPLYLGFHSLSDEGTLGPFPFTFDEGIHTRANPPFIENILLRTARALEEAVDAGRSFAATIVTPDWSNAEFAIVLSGIDGIEMEVVDSAPYNLYDPSKDAPGKINMPVKTRVYNYRA